MDRPGLYEEFAKWHWENSQDMKIDSLERWHPAFLETDYCAFVNRTWGSCFFPGRGHVPYPGHLIAMRDMALI